MYYRSVILDRDGVINKLRHDYVLSSSQLIFIPNSLSAIASMQFEGIKVSVATNQSPIGRGLLKEKELSKIHNCINKNIYMPMNFYVCPHLPDDGCNCRKPNSGLLELIKTKVEGPHIFIGDNITDYQAAKKANIDFAFVQSGHVIKRSYLVEKNIKVYSDLMEFWETLNL